MVADEPLLHTFLDDVGATDAQVLYFTRLGGPPDGKEHFSFPWEPLKEGTDTVTTDL